MNKNLTAFDGLVGTHGAINLYFLFNINLYKGIFNVLS